MLFFAAIRRDSVSLSFSFLSHVFVFSFDMSIVCHVKRSHICFSSHFCFLGILVLLTLVLSAFSGRCNQSSSSSFYVIFESVIDLSTLSSMPASPTFPSFLDICSLLKSTLGCYALCMVISFLVFWSIRLSSCLVDFKNSPEYLTRGTAQVFTPFIRFLLNSLVSRSFLVLRIYYF